MMSKHSTSARGAQIQDQFSRHSRVFADLAKQATTNAADEDVKAMTDAALRIISYRPGITVDKCRKATFLAEYTDGTLLTEAEQVAAVSSLMPEGGAA